MIIFRKHSREPSQLYLCIHHYLRIHLVLKLLWDENDSMSQYYISVTRPLHALLNSMQVVSGTSTAWWRSVQQPALDLLWLAKANCAFFSHRSNHPVWHRVFVRQCIYTRPDQWSIITFCATDQTQTRSYYSLNIIGS